MRQHLGDLETFYFGNAAATSGGGAHGSSVVATATRDEQIGAHAPILDDFSDNLAKLTRYAKMEVRATLKYGELANTSLNIVSSMDFDRDDEFFAMGGVTRKIKIFEYSSVVQSTVPAHFPVTEMSCSSKVSCLAWNTYIKSVLASSDYEGIVTLWDVERAVATRSLEEHQKRVWCVDFSLTDPTRLASASDDTTVKIWSTTQPNAVGSIESKANVCCVKFNPSSAYHIVFGSADHSVNYYDLRHTREPLMTYRGHQKAVSYVKFMNDDEFVTASTDSTLKLWNKRSAECQRTFKGHQNEKNFVGLAANSDYISCGSESNAAFVYTKSLSRPLLTYNFTSVNPTTGVETERDSSEFVSSVCWKRKSNILLAANSQGTIKILEPVCSQIEASS